MNAPKPDIAAAITDIVERNWLRVGPRSELVVETIVDTEHPAIDADALADAAEAVLELTRDIDDHSPLTTAEADQIIARYPRALTKLRGDRRLGIETKHPVRRAAADEAR